jgi:hypothetical protein
VERFRAIGIGSGDDDRIQLEVGRSLLGDPPGALCLSTVLIRLSPIWSPEDCRTQANALHLNQPPHFGLDIVPA